MPLAQKSRLRALKYALRFISKANISNASLYQGAGLTQGRRLVAKAREWLARRAGCWGVIRPRWLQSRSPNALPSR